MTVPGTPFLSSRAVDVSLRSAEGTRGAGRTTLFLLGGEAPEASWLRDFAERNDPELWAVDSGVAACRAAGLPPEAIVGDRDSASEADWAWAVAAGAREYRFPSAKDLTDFQLALDIWRRERLPGRPYPILSGCFGGRFDHFQSVLDTYAMFERTHGGRCMIDDKQGIFLLYSGESIFLDFIEAPGAISLIPLSDVCRDVCIEGVRWPLDNVVLERRLPWAISNEIVPGAPVSAGCGEGTMAVYWCGRG